MQCFIRNLLIRILLGIMPVTAYADQKCYGDIIVFQRFDDQAIYPYFAPVSNDKTKKREVRNKTIIIQKRKQKQDEFLAQKKNEEVHTKEEKKNSENKKENIHLFIENIKSKNSLFFLLNYFSFLLLKKFQLTESSYINFKLITIIYKNWR